MQSIPDTLEERNPNPWFALHIRMHDSDYVETSLRHRGFETFAPTYMATRTVARGEKQVRTPLFPGYLFCSLDPNHRIEVVTVPGVINILGTKNAPTPVLLQEIEAIRRALDSGLPVEPFRLIEPGELVEVKSGPLEGVKGVVLYSKGKCRLVITVAAMNDRAMSVEVDRITVVRLDSTRGCANPEILCAAAKSVAAP